MDPPENMGKHYSENLKNVVVNMRNKSKTYQEIANLTKIPKPIIYSIVKKHATTGKITRLLGSGRRKILGECDVNNMLKMVRKNLFFDFKRGS